MEQESMRGVLPTGFGGEAKPVPAAFIRDPEMQEYLLVLHPADEVAEKVNEEKKQFYEAYRQKVAVKTKPHITIACFLAKETMEETLIRWIQRVCGQQKRFNVTLNNYSGFPPHTIYLRVQDHQPFRLLAQQLKIIDRYVETNGCPEIQWITRPHLSIARRLPAEIYEKAIRRYAQKIFHESFCAEELLLLKRAHQFDTCKIVNRFHLQPEERNLFS